MDGIVKLVKPTPLISKTYSIPDSGSLMIGLAPSVYQDSSGRAVFCTCGRSIKVKQVFRHELREFQPQFESHNMDRGSYNM